MVLERHLDSLASAVSAELATIGSGETYALPTASTSTKGGIIVGDGLSMRGDTLNVTVSSGETYSDFTGATSSTGGLSGLVPAPSIGDQNKFLRGDGSWGTPANTGAGIALSSVASGVEGALWRDSINDTPVLKLRHGDYEYNFNYDGLTFLGGSSSAIATVTPDTYVLGTATVSSEGGLWYDTANDTPKLNMHAGNFVYSFSYDTITYKGDNSNLASYLPFDSSATSDACGNSWTATGGVSLDTTIKKFGSASLKLALGAQLSSTDILDLSAEKWTFDTYFRTTQAGNANKLQFGGYNTGVVVEGMAPRIAASTGKKPPALINELETWHHIAFVRDGWTFRFFVDGVLQDTRTLTSFTPDNTFLLAGDGGYVWFDNVRFFDGVALWTSDFTPPTAADYS